MNKNKIQRVVGWPPLILCGPSGSGKTTIKNHLIKKYPDKFQFSISYTTRQPRGEEKHGIDYFFVEKETFEKEVTKNNFIEYNRVHDNYYGTHRDVVTSIVTSNKICILDIDVQGVKMALTHGLKVSNRLFLLPPSIDLLKERLEKRGTDSQEAINRRITNAMKEIELANQLNIFHVFIKNDRLDYFLRDCEGVIEEFYPFIKNSKLL